MATAPCPGLSAGTIIYVVMFEVLQREKSRDVPGLLQVGASPLPLLNFPATASGHCDRLLCDDADTVLW